MSKDFKLMLMWIDASWCGVFISNAQNWIHVLIITLVAYIVFEVLAKDI